MTDKSSPVLIVEDSMEDYEAVRQAFKRANLASPLELLLSGEAALEYLRSENKPSPCLILLDLNMPGIGGYKTLETIKKDNALKEIPVVMLSGSDSQTSIKMCYAMGANGYITKSADFNILATAIKRLKEYWLDTVVLPPIFDDDAIIGTPASAASADGKITFSVSLDSPENERLENSARQSRHEVHLSPTAFQEKIMGSGPHKPLSAEIKLTSGEIETLVWIARGKSRWETGVILGVGEDAVKARLEKIRQKLNASNTTHAIAIALLNGLISL